MSDQENNDSVNVEEGDSDTAVEVVGVAPYAFMEEVIKRTWKGAPRIDELIEGIVLHRKKGELFVDLGKYGTGIVYGREYYNAREKFKTLNFGDALTAKVVSLENEDGYVELSVAQAGQDLMWQEVLELVAKKEMLELQVVAANKGGLVLEYRGVKGFLPSSQLSSEHYPRVEGGDKEKILEELQKLIGKTLNVVIIVADSSEEKLIFSEKGAEPTGNEELIKKYSIGDAVEGEITGVVDFGVFIKVEEGLEGLAHISELDWALVEDPGKLFKVGEKVKTKIIAIEDGKLSLSIKALKEDPWETAANKYKKGDILEGAVLRLNKFGALISLEEGIYGLAHISEFGSEPKMREMAQIGKKYPVQIVMFHPDVHKLALAFLGAHKPAEMPALEEKK